MRSTTAPARGASWALAREQQAMDEQAAVERARELFLDDRNLHGCAETTFIVLAEAFDLGAGADPAAAMALNGGVAYSGGTCGAITGAALAVGVLAGRRIPDHAAAKRAARLVLARLIDEFAREHGALDCRRLTGVDLRTEAGHRAFIESGAWRDGCMRQVGLVVRRLAPLGEEAAWEKALRELEATGP
jgi:C_GCAxxG_C_C family probable redox protein